MRQLSLLTALLLAAGACALPGSARAYQFTGTFPGGDCRAMAAGKAAPNLWYGHFTGRRENPFLPNLIEGKTVEGCFRSKGECENWLYQWRSAWQFDFWNDYCVKGYPPPPRGWRPRNG